jgi:hypothetical protein
MLKAETTALCSEIRSKHINNLRKNNAEFLSLNLAVRTCISSLQSLKGLVTYRHSMLFRTETVLLTG